QRNQSPRPPLDGAQLVQHPVLRHLEEPGRELAAKRELRQALEDPQENFLREVFGEAAVAVHEAEDVVEDGRFVRSQDQRKRSLVSSLRLPQDARVRLGEAQGWASIERKLLMCRDFVPTSVRVS